MGIVKLSTNKYKIIIELGYDILGNRKRKTEVVYGNKSDAIKREAELKSDYYHIGMTSNISDITFKEYSEIFLEKYCTSNVSLITIKSYKQLLGKINPLIGHYKLNKITSFVLDNMYKSLRIGKNNKIIKSETMLHFYRLINVMFEQAVKWNFVSLNPNKDTIKPKREKYERKSYDINQVKTLLECLKNENIKYRTLITLAIDSGARRSEICALKWSDISFEDCTIFIDNSLKVVGGIVDEKNAKNTYSIRKIVVSESTIDLLKEYKEWQNVCKKNMGKLWHDENRVFTSKDGKHIHPDTCGDILNKIINKYNLPKITFHELRHTCTSLLIDSGTNVKAVSLRLGHSNTSTTMNIYTHSFDSNKLECAKVFDKIIKNT